MLNSIISSWLLILTPFRRHNVKICWRKDLFWWKTPGENVENMIKIICPRYFQIYILTCFLNFLEIYFASKLDHVFGRFFFLFHWKKLRAKFSSIQNLHIFQIVLSAKPKYVFGVLAQANNQNMINTNIFNLKYKEKKKIDRFIWNLDRRFIWNLDHRFI